MTTQVYPEVRNNTERQQYEVEIDGQLSVLNYIQQGDTLILTHTGVPKAQRGRGIATHLVKSALDDIRAHNLRIQPMCSYVSAFLRRHPEYRSLVAA